jgi:predicted Rdx family selenoprotein
MTQDEIIEMLRQSDLDFLLGDSWMMQHELETFAKLVAAKEREACAKFFIENSTNLFWGSQAAHEIRARGEA